MEAREKSKTKPKSFHEWLRELQERDFNDHFLFTKHFSPERAEGRFCGEEDKNESDAVNPAHYQVEGIPEAIEIIQGLMTKEQFEGFLWGNILKYAYRYGRKGDKKETAGKIAWYAKKLKEVANDN